MTIGRSATWGTPVDRPDGLRVAHSDRELASLLLDGTERPVAVAAGDLHLTLGAPVLAGRDELIAYPIDLVRITLDERSDVVAVAHLLARSTRRRGGWWRGDALAVMNAEHVGGLVVAPRGHPNDGRVETLLAGPSLRFRQRLAARARLRSGSHLPHPEIRSRSVRTGRWAFDRPVRVRVDGVEIGTARSIEIHVDPDAAIVHA